VNVSIRVNMDRFKKRNVWIVVLIGALIFALFAQEVGFNEFISRISRINKLLFLLVILFNFLNVLASRSHGGILFPTRSVSTGYSRSLWQGHLLTISLPRSGLEASSIKAMLLGKETGISKAECFAGVVCAEDAEHVPVPDYRRSGCGAFVLKGLK